MKTDRAEALRQEWRERLSNLLNGMLDEPAREALQALKRRAFGDEEFEREVRDEMATDRKIRELPPPDPKVRKRLKPLWGWNKRMRGR